MAEQTLKEELKAALQKTAPVAAPAEAEKEEAVETENVSSDDTATGTETEKEPDPVPYGRFKEKVDEANLSKAEAEKLREENKQLVTQLTETLSTIKSGDKITKEEKVEAREDIETLVKNGTMTREDADNFLRALNAAGVARGTTESDKKVSAMEKELKELKQVLYGDKDAQNLKSAVAQFDGIVSEEDVKAKLKEMVNSKDPDRVHAANNFSYEKIIKMEFGEQIYKAETEKVLKAKKEPAPKVPVKGSKDSPKKPDEAEVVYDPANPRAFSRSLRDELRNKMRSSE